MATVLDDCTCWDLPLFPAFHIIQNISPGWAATVQVVGQIRASWILARGYKSHHKWSFCPERMRACFIKGRQHYTFSLSFVFANLIVKTHFIRFTGLSSFVIRFKHHCKSPWPASLSPPAGALVSFWLTWQALLCVCHAWSHHFSQWTGSLNSFYLVFLYYTHK